MQGQISRRGAAAMIVCAAFALARPVHADSVYKCRGADGAIAYQDHACAKSTVESQVEIAPAPPPSASPDYGRETRAPRETYVRTHASTPVRRETVSYACRAANGEVFYRHGTCPAKITAKGVSGKKAGESYGVTAEPLSRSEACRRMASAGSIGRAGHERDERVSTYERNLGRDPCRYF